MRCPHLPRTGALPVAASMLVAWAAQFGIADPQHSPQPSEQKTYDSSLSVIPPVPISNHVEFEIRVAVRNQSIKDAKFELVLSIERADGETQPLWATPLEVEPHGQELISKRFPAASFVGKNRITYRLSGPDGFVKNGHWPLHVVDCDDRAVPLLQIGWMDPGAVKGYSKHTVTERDLRAAVDAYRDLGMTALIITYPESIYSGSAVYYPSRAFADYGSTVEFDVVGTILNQASKNGQKVFVGLGRGPDLLLTWTGFDDPDRIRTALAHSMKTATELWALYSHEPSFYGWYLTHEANDIAQASRAYYNPMVDFLHTFEADKPVLISPSGTPILSREILAASKVDIFAYQDAVGSGYIPYENTFDPQRRIKMLKDVYASYADAHRESGKHLWANLEIWQMDGPEYGNSYPPKFERVQAQLDIEKDYVDVITTYELLGFMERPDSEVALGGQRASDLFEAYRSYYQATSQRLGMINPSEK
jgi:hypothetical protein